MSTGAEAANLERKPGVTLGDDIRTLARIFGHRGWMIAAIVASFLVVGILYLWSATPGYTSLVEILVDPRARNVVEGEVAPSGLGSSSFGADTTLVDSQAGIITSRSVLDALIDQNDLLYDPEFGRRGESMSASIADAVKAVLYGPNASAYDSQSPYDRAIEKLEQAIAVERVGNTYILRIAVTTGAADKSAILADGLAKLYLAEGQVAANSSSDEAASALEARLDALKQQAEAAQQAVETYRAAHNLIGADNLPVDEAQLRDLNDQVTAASIATEDANARLEELRRLATLPASASVSSNILTSPVALDLRAQLQLAIADVQSLSASLGPRHPNLVRAQERRAALEQALSQEFTRIVATAESDYQTALGKQQSLEALRADYVARQGSANSAGVELGNLQRVADTQTAVYQSFLTRSIQARQQVALPASTARIISPALPSSEPSEPKVTVVLGAAIFLGVAIGFGLAFLQHVLYGTPVASADARARGRWTVALPRLKLRRRGRAPAVTKPRTAAPQTVRPQAAVAQQAPRPSSVTSMPAQRPAARTRAAAKPANSGTQTAMKKILAQLMR